MRTIRQDSPTGNTELVEYGIQTEGSDLRAHVGFVVRRIYVYRTEQALLTINRGQYKTVPVYTQGITTATGYIVPPENIPGCLGIFLAESVWNRFMPGKTDTTSVKGDRAVDVVKWALLNGYFPLALSPDVIDDFEMQIEGTDILIDSNIKVKIQVKCDYRCGPKALGGTGNLFLQTAECNPWQEYGEHG